MAEVGPVAVNICIDDSFQHYKGGIYETENCCDTDDAHAPVVIGYGTDKKDGDYWILKNSWGLLKFLRVLCKLLIFILIAGTTWGDKGFGKFRRGENMCDIGYYAVVSCFNHCATFFQFSWLCSFLHSMQLKRQSKAVTQVETPKELFAVQSLTTS